jgi:hypothetical protein
MNYTLQNGVEVEVEYQSDQPYSVAVVGGDVAVQRYSKAKAAKVTVFNSPILDGQEVTVKTQSSTNLLYFTATVDNTYVDFNRTRH